MTRIVVMKIDHDGGCGGSGHGGDKFGIVYDVINKIFKIFDFLFSKSFRDFMVK